MWVSYSPDLRHWGSHKLMMQARRGSWWDANKIGLSPPPIETPQGWLVIYHGVKHTAAGCIYRLGLALFDLHSPERCLKRADEWVFGPEEPYDQHGDSEGRLSVGFAIILTKLSNIRQKPIPNQSILAIVSQSRVKASAYSTRSLRAKTLNLEENDDLDN